MEKINQEESGFQNVHQRYAAKLPDLLQLIESNWKQVLDSRWSTPVLQGFLLLIHRLSGSSASYGYAQINTAARMVESILRKIIENPIGATGENQEQLEIQVDLLRTAFQEDQQPDASSLINFKAINDTLRTARASQRIFLVEDDPLQAEQITEQLNYFGYLVTTFSSPARLLDLVSQQPPKPILMDIIFPEGFNAGPEAVIQMEKQIPNLPPVIFISENGGFLTRLQAIRAGGEAYFTKPVDITALVEALDHLTMHEIQETGRVLVVDDSESDAARILGNLKQFGMETRLVTDPLYIMSALDEFQPNILLLDMNLTTCSGPELARVIRQIEKYVFTPIIYMSASDDPQARLADLLSDSEDYVDKDIPADRLKNILQSHLEHFRQLRALMVRDSLTGLYNHISIKERLEQELSRANRLQSELCLAMIDLDHFKQVNDLYGHSSGDRVLKSLARFLVQRLRKTDVIGRYGGEEFCVILPDTPISAAIKVLNELRSSFALVHHRGGSQDFHVELSAGIASYPRYPNPTALIEAADRALYEAKERGRNQVCAADQ